MPLSEHEQKMLAEMEQALAAEDPKFASQMKGSPFSGPRGRRLVVGVLGVLAGLGVILGAVNASLTWLGVVGFALMVAAAAYALSSPRGPKLQVVDGGAAPRSGPAKGARPRRSGGFMDRMDERWDRRDGR